jgi:type I restriction enzyme M protein
MRDWMSSVEHTHYIIGSVVGPHPYPDIVARFQNLKEEANRSRTDKSFMVPVKEIQDNKYDLSINRYKEVVYEEKVYEKPNVIIGQIEALDKERADLLKQLKAMLA